MRNEAFIRSLRAPFGKLDTTLPEARALVQLVGMLGIVVTGIQGNQTVFGPGGAAEVSEQAMRDQGVTDQDEIFLELTTPGQTGGIDVAQTIADLRANWRAGVKQLMVDIYENDAIATERAANAITSIPAVAAA